jgi:CheY-like chemotaxis protein
MARALRVLLVEDHDNSRESFKLLLEYWGYSVDTAADGQQGLNLAVNGSYDAVILDLHLPRVDGLDVGHVLSQVIPRPYLFAYTAWSRPQDRERTKNAGFDAHIAKGSGIALGELKALLSQLQARLRD